MNRVELEAEERAWNGVNWNVSGVDWTPTNGTLSTRFEEGEYLFDRTDVRAIFISLYTVVFCCCFFGNLLVMLVVMLHWRMRSITNFFLANLAFADFCVGIFCVYQNLSIYLATSWVLGEFLCKVYHFIHHLSYTASVFILVALCVERYLAIIHPMRCKQLLTMTRLKVVIVLVWSTSAVYSAPRLYWFQTIRVSLSNGTSEVLCVPLRLKYDSRSFDVASFLLLYLIPLAVILVLYSRIGLALWRSSRRPTTYNHHHPHQCLKTPSMESSSFSMKDSASPSSSIDGKKKRPLRPALRIVKYRRSKRPAKDASLVLDEDAEDEERTRHPETDHVLISTQSQQQDDGGDDEPRLIHTILQQNSLNGGATSAPDSPQLWANHRASSAHFSCNGTHATTRPPFLHKHLKVNRCGCKSSTGCNNSSNNALAARRRVIRMLVAVVVTFAVCNLPYHARKMWQHWSPSYDGTSAFSTLLTPVTFLVMYSNSGINPVLYAFMSRNFRRSIRDLLCCRITRANSAFHRDSSTRVTTRVLRSSAT